MGECDHIWQSDDEFEMGGLGETVEKPVICEECGKEATEVWIFSCYVDEEGKQIDE